MTYVRFGFKARKTPSKTEKAQTISLVFGEVVVKWIVRIKSENDEW